MSTTRCFWIVVLEKTLETPLDSKEIKPVNPKGNQSWIFIGRTDAEAETPVLWPPDVKNWLIWKDPDAGTDWRQEEKGMREDEMFGWHHWLNGNEFEQALGDGEEQGSLAWCSPWGHTTEWLNKEQQIHIQEFQNLSQLQTKNWTMVCRNRIYCPIKNKINPETWKANNFDTDFML